MAATPIGPETIGSPPAWRWIALALLLLAALFAGRISLIGVSFPLDYNEGWNAAHAALAMGSGALYPPAGSLTGTNYPPLSFYVVGWLCVLTGDPIVAGRMLALLAVFSVAATIALIVRRMGGADRNAPAIAALIFLGFNATLFRNYLAMNDPQWLGHALMTAGFFVLVPKVDEAPSGRCVAGAALLMVLGGLVKHNLVALPLAATAWLALHHRHQLIVWMITGLLGTAIAAAICLQLFGTEIFRNIFGGDRVYSLARMLIKSAPVLAAFAPAIIVSVRLLPMRRSDRRLDLFLLAAAFGLVLGFIQRSGQGVDRNAHFEALIALSITGALALAKGGSAADRSFLRRPLALLILPLLVLLPQAIRADVNEYKDRTRNEQIWKSLVDRIAATPGRVACELPAACFRAGKAYEVDFFLYGQRVLVRHDASALRQAIKERRFAAIQLDPPDGSSKPGKVRDPLHVMFEQHYRTNFTDDAGRRLLMPIDR